MGLRRLIALGLLAGCVGAGELGSQERALRPDTHDASLPPPAYEREVTVEHLDSASFRVHYARTGRHAVPGADVDRDGVPDAVQTVSTEYERVLAFLRDQLGFRAPLSDRDLADENGGDGRFDVYLVDFPTSSDGSFVAEGCSGSTCTGYMLQENDFDGRGYPSLLTATRILASHELFHAVQNAYRALPSQVLNEATAVWASERYEPALQDFEHFVPTYLAHADRSLLQEPLGPPDSFSYAASLWFEMLGEACGPRVVHALWEELAETRDAWTLALDRVLQRDCARTLASLFLEFARWNLQTGARASDEGYENARAYPLVTEAELTLPFEDDIVRTLPLSTRYFVMSSREPVAAWANEGTLSWLLATERADGTLRELRAVRSDALASITPETGERVHVALVDARSAGATLRVALCIGGQAHVAACKTRLGGVVTMEPDAGALDAGVHDAAVAPWLDASVPERPRADAALDAAREGDGGCSLASPASSAQLLVWLLLSLASRRFHARHESR